MKNWNILLESLASNNKEFKYHTLYFNNFSSSSSSFSFFLFFFSFGTQSALIAGFTLSNITQVDALGSNASNIWKWIFWVSCSIVLVASLHVVLTTTFINIFGPGLALRGPAG